MITTRKLFRYLWRANAVLIFLVTAASAFLLGTLLISEVGCRALRRRAHAAAPAVVADTTERLYLGPVRLVEGSDVLRGELLAPQDGAAISSGGYRTETRNVLYFDGQSSKARWLLPDNRHVISEESIVYTEVPESDSRRQLAVLALIKSASDDVTTAEGTLLIHDPAGRQVRTVAQGVRALNHASILKDGEILVLYEKNRRYVRSVIDAESFKVENESEVNVPEL